MCINEREGWKERDKEGWKSRVLIKRSCLSENLLGVELGNDSEDEQESLLWSCPFLCGLGWAGLVLDKECDAVQLAAWGRREGSLPSGVNFQSRHLDMDEMIWLPLYMRRSPLVNSTRCTKNITHTFACHQSCYSIPPPLLKRQITYIHSHAARMTVHNFCMNYKLSLNDVS